MPRKQGVRCWGYLRHHGRAAVCTRIVSPHPDRNGGWFRWLKITDGPAASLPSEALVPTPELANRRLGSRDSRWQDGLFGGWERVRAALVEADQGGVLLRAFHALFGDACARRTRGCVPGVFQGSRSGRYRYTCSCIEGRDIGLVDAYAASITGKVAGLSEHEYGRWAIRLLRAADAISDWTGEPNPGRLPEHGVRALPLPADATEEQAELYRDVLEAFACQWYIDPFAPMPLARSFLARWSRVSGSPRRPFEALTRYELVKPTGMKIAVRGRDCQTWLPAIPREYEEAELLGPEDVHHHRQP
jgi:hypothetical protein